jgi:hypothetical protein
VHCAAAARSPARSVSDGKSGMVSATMLRP